MCTNPHSPLVDMAQVEVEMHARASLDWFFTRALARATLEAENTNGASLD